MRVPKIIVADYALLICIRCRQRRCDDRMTQRVACGMLKEERSSGQIYVTTMR